MSKKLVIEIELEGTECMQETPEWETKGFLRKVIGILNNAENIDAVDGTVFMDTNGNKVGTCKIK